MAVQALRRSARRRTTTAAATIAYRAGATPATGNTAGPFTVTVPGTVAAGDLLVLAVVWTTATSATTVEAPAGWTLLSPPGQIDDEAQVSVRVWTKVAVAGDISGSVALTFGAVVKAVLMLEAYSGAADVLTAQAAVEGDVAVSTHTTPTAGVTKDNCWYIEIVGDKAATSTTTWTPPAGRTLRHSGSTASTGSSAAIGDSNGTVAQGTVGGGVWSSNGSTTTRAVMLTLVIEPGLGTNPSPATIAYRAGSTPATGNTTSFAVTIPTSAQLGDLVFLAIGWGWNSTVPTIAGPSDFTVLSIGQQDDESNLSTKVWTKVVGAGDPGRTVTITTAGVIKAVLFCEVYTGVGAAGVLAAGAAIEGATATLTHSTALLSNAEPSAWLVSIMFDRAATGTTAWAIPGSEVLRHDAYTTGTSAVTGAFVDGGSVEAAGSVGGLVFTGNGATTSKAVGYSILLAPGGSTGGGGSNQGKAIMGLFNSTSRPGSGNPDGQNAGAGFSAGGDTAVNWRNVVDDYMSPTYLKVRRCFNSGMPSSDVTGNPAQGIVSAFSVKGNMASAASGALNSQFATLAAAMPNGSYLIFHHEPENDVASGTFTATQWVNAQTQFYTTCKGVNSTLIIGPAYTAYQWGSSMPSTSNPALWALPTGIGDYLGVDAYAMEFTTGYSGIQDDARFQRWFNWAKTQGRPLMFTEFACVRRFMNGVDPNPGNGTFSDVVWTYRSPDPYTDAQAAAFIRNTVTWGLANGFKGFWYWNALRADFLGSGTSTSPWHFRDEMMNPSNTSDTIQAYTSPLMLAAWNEMCTTYGSTSPNLFDTL